MLDLPPPVPPPSPSRSWLPPQFPASAVLFGAILAVLAMLLFWRTATTIDIRGEHRVNLAGVAITLVVAMAAVATLYSLLGPNVIAFAVLFNVMLAILLVACVPSEGEFTRYLFQAIAAHTPIGEADVRLLIGLVFGTAYFVGAVVGLAIALVRNS